MKRLHDDNDRDEARAAIDRLLEARMHLHEIDLRQYRGDQELVDAVMDARRSVGQALAEIRFARRVEFTPVS